MGAATASKRKRFVASVKGVSCYRGHLKCNLQMVQHLCQVSFNPFTAMLVALSFGKRAIKMPNLKSLRTSCFFT